MRIDKFLNSVNITKRRPIAQDMISNGVVLINDTVVKASKNVAVGDVVTINYLSSTKRYKKKRETKTDSCQKRVF